MSIQSIREQLEVRGEEDLAAAIEEVTAVMKRSGKKTVSLHSSFTPEYYRKHNVASGDEFKHHHKEAQKLGSGSAERLKHSSAMEYYFNKHTPFSNLKDLDSLPGLTSSIKATLQERGEDDLVASLEEATADTEEADADIDHISLKSGSYKLGTGTHTYAVGRLLKKHGIPHELDYVKKSKLRHRLHGGGAPFRISEDVQQRHHIYENSGIIVPKKHLAHARAIMNHYYALQDYKTAQNRATKEANRVKHWAAKLPNPDKKFGNRHLW